MKITNSAVNITNYVVRITTSVVNISTSVVNTVYVVKIVNSDHGAGDRRAPSGEKGGDVGYTRLEERMAMRFSGIQEFMNSGIREFRNSGIQEFRNSQEFWNSDIEQLFTSFSIFQQFS